MEVISYLILSYLILSYLILSYLILSYLILSYLILSYLIFNECIIKPIATGYFPISPLTAWLTALLFKPNNNLQNLISTDSAGEIFLVSDTVKVITIKIIENIRQPDLRTISQNR